MPAIPDVPCSEDSPTDVTLFLMTRKGKRLLRLICEVTTRSDRKRHACIYVYGKSLFEWAETDLMHIAPNAKGEILVSFEFWDNDPVFKNAMESSLTHSSLKGPLATLLKKNPLLMKLATIGHTLGVKFTGNPIKAICDHLKALRWESDDKSEDFRDAGLCIEMLNDCTRNPLSPRDAENLKTAIATQDEKRDEMFAALQAKSDIVKQDALALTKLQVVSVEKNTEASKRELACAFDKLQKEQQQLVCAGKVFAYNFENRMEFIEGRYNQQQNEITSLTTVVHNMQDEISRQGEVLLEHGQRFENHEQRFDDQNKRMDEIHDLVLQQGQAFTSPPAKVNARFGSPGTEPLGDAANGTPDWLKAAASEVLGDRASHDDGSLPNSPPDSPGAASAASAAPPAAEHKGAASPGACTMVAIGAIGAIAAIAAIVVMYVST